MWAILLILALFVMSVADLGDGDLVHGDNFNLFAAMSALEVLSVAEAWFLFLVSSFKL